MITQSTRDNPAAYLITGIIRVTKQIEIRSNADGSRYYLKLDANATLDTLKVGEFVTID